MGQLKIVINTRESSDTNDRIINPNTNDVASLTRLTNWMRGLATRGGANIQFEVGGVQSSGTLTLTDPVADGDTAVVNGITLTARTAPSLASEFQIGNDEKQTAANLAALINSTATINIVAIADAVSGVVNVKATNVGTAGDAITTTATGNIAAGAGTLASGAAGTVTAVALGRTATA